MARTGDDLGQGFGPGLGRPSGDFERAPGRFLVFEVGLPRRLEGRHVLDVVEHVLDDGLGVDLLAGLGVCLRQEHEVAVAHQAAVPFQVAGRGRVPVQSAGHVQGGLTQVKYLAHEQIRFTRFVMVVDGPDLFLVVVADPFREHGAIVRQTGFE